MRFTRRYRSLVGPVLRVFGAVFPVLRYYILYYAFFYFIAPSSFQNVIGGMAFSFTVLTVLIRIAVSIARPRASRLGSAVSVIKKLVPGETDVCVCELVVDRSGLTIRRTLAGTFLPGTHLPWRDIAQIGVLQPERGALNHCLPADQYTRTHVLVVRLRPDVPAPRVVSVLSDEHRQLGYLGLCAAEELGSPSQEMIRALERFAGGKLVHSSRQFLDRDPRLRPEIV